MKLFAIILFCLKPNFQTILWRYVMWNAWHKKKVLKMFSFHIIHLTSV